jgi:hypothetical protein
MNWNIWQPLASKYFTGMLAQQESNFTTIEWNWPTQPWGAFLFWTGAILAIIWIVWLYQKDTRHLSPFWRIWLGFWRLTVFLALIVIAGHPQERTQKMSFRPSRVVILVDTSTSMQNPIETPGTIETDTNQKELPTRTEALRHLLADSDFLPQLQNRHEVRLYTFDQALEGPFLILPSEDERVNGMVVTAAEPTSVENTDLNTNEKNLAPAQNSAGKSNTDLEAKLNKELSNAVPQLVKDVNWEQILLPRGAETRLGDALTEIMSRESGKTLAGLILATDGVSNAGVNPLDLNVAVKDAKLRLYTLGLGGLKNPTNVEVTRIMAPTDVQIGDAFDIHAFIQTQSMIGQSVNVQLESLPADNKQATPAIIATKTIPIIEDGVPVEIIFEQKPLVPGQTIYGIRATPAIRTHEMRDSDNYNDVTISATDRPMKVLLIAGGPSRDYTFLRTSLNRHRSIEVDVYLQSGEVGISQDAHELLYQFPNTRNDLFKYDVIVCFDPEWNNVTLEQKNMLLEWVKNQGGGIVFVVGDVNTPALATTSNPEDEPIKTLLPVFLSDYFVDIRNDSSTSDPWPLELTPEGREASFMQITDDPTSSMAAWDEFSGVHRCYPTAGVKASALVYAYHNDQRRIDEHGQPIFLASQFLGQGKSIYIGTPEVYRIRGYNPEYFERFWTKLIRNAAQGRMQRGHQRGLFLLDNTQIGLGQTFNLKTRLMDAEFKPLSVENVDCEVIMPNGKSLLPALKLKPDPRRPGDYLATFRGTLPGRYRFQLKLPDTDEVIEQHVDIILPRLEEQEYRQNVKLLREMTQDTGGDYYTLSDIETLPEKIPNQGEEFLLAERLQALWDHQWVMYLLVAALSIEWLTRKLLRLA